MCTGPTVELGCGSGRLVAELIQRGIPALGIDRSATAIRLAGRGGAPALLGDVFEPLGSAWSSSRWVLAKLWSVIPRLFVWPRSTRPPSPRGPQPKPPARVGG